MTKGNDKSKEGPLESGALILLKCFDYKSGVM